MTGLFTEQIYGRERDNWPQTKPSANTGFQHKTPWNKVDLRMVTECMEKKSKKRGHQEQLAGHEPSPRNPMAPFSALTLPRLEDATRILGEGPRLRPEKSSATDPFKFWVSMLVISGFGSGWRATERRKECKRDGFAARLSVFWTCKRHKKLSLLPLYCNRRNYRVQACVQQSGLFLLRTKRGSQRRDHETPGERKIYTAVTVLRSSGNPFADTRPLFPLKIFLDRPR